MIAHCRLGQLRSDAGVSAAASVNVRVIEAARRSARAKAVWGTLQHRRASGGVGGVDGLCHLRKLICTEVARQAKEATLFEAGSAALIDGAMRRRGGSRCVLCHHVVDQSRNASTAVVLRHSRLRQMQLAL